jgi:type IV pilus assembly protein PilA
MRKMTYTVFRSSFLVRRTPSIVPGTCSVHGEPYGARTRGTGDGGRWTAYGFTLIEMMITVAIVAILAAIAIPMYDRYQAKTRQSEAKMDLSSVYASEMAFYSEYSAYISAFDALHFRPEGSRRYYTVGWSADMSGTVTGYSGSYGNSVYDSQNTASTFVCPPSMAKPLLPAPVNSDSQTFTVGAAGEVRIGQGCDVWTIDETKNLLNTVNKL